MLMLVVDMEFVKDQQLMDFGVTAIMDTVVKIALRERTVNIYTIHNIMIITIRINVQIIFRRISKFNQRMR
jgi:hypothetical protein